MNNTFLSLLIVSFLACSASAFVVPDVPMAAIQQQQNAAGPALVVTQNSQQLLQGRGFSPMQDGIREYLSTSSTSSSTMTLSLVERPPPPTAEEIAAKKRNFSFWFWGGGFVAPFLATFYYFGFRFWER
ncbi:hypothetical protein FRACYDRAFT_269960 [Fragilariopsis cylindrus CCMP1102]|uniref:Transmembrane protein n=1 Tax=Fragilariopsis cylindrus CCMP1102 TaxID=635003 RepID=A0A1E7F6W7_9STRA|nr:hypothetical protein FRACYDRAFT_269960 [Fragilariopsis cylindrus CCMP1102]|eukprot:OEU13921.1 hypothetical protein FRACYDRAFT_269960 [Fragilariopsis cylindrus CCMP1102]